jgi:hypothetical protein
MANSQLSMWLIGVMLHKRVHDGVLQPEELPLLGYPARSVRPVLELSAAVR